MLITRNETAIATLVVSLMIIWVGIACDTAAPSEPTSASTDVDTPVSTSAAMATPHPTFETAPEPTATPLPTPTATLGPTATPLPTPTATPDISGMAADCGLAQARHRGINLLQWLGSVSDDSQTPAPLEDEPDACLEFRRQFPDDFARLIGNTISGTFTLYDDDLFVVTRESPLKGHCLGQGGYDDIGGGLGVVIKNGEGKIIANDELWSGKLTGLNECTFPFYITSVPDTDFYQIEVGQTWQSGVFTLRFRVRRLASWIPD